jgi:hypothetical protein
MLVKKIAKAIFFIFLISVSSGLSMAAGDDAPAWLRQAASASVPGYQKNVPAVVLLDEQTVTLGTDGRLVTVANYAVKLLTKEGKSTAVARAFYLVSAGKIRSIDAWVIRTDGSVKRYDKNTVLDIISDPDDVYNEGRLKVIDASGDVDTGYVFGYTVVSEDLPLFYQDTWLFQGRLPTLVSRYTLSLPAGWKAASITLNGPEVKPSVNGTTYTWELRDLKPIPPEPLSPSFRNLAPRIAINYSPDSATQSVNKAFSNWLDVSRWAATLYEPQVIIDDSIAAKARELTEGKATEFEKIRAIATFVQNLQYISIDIGVAHGNGYKPRPSNLVLNRGYGDCKDKANLMRALLKVLKIDAYPVAIYSGDPTFVRAEWASPSQFNHCIIAVKVSPETKAETIIEHPTLGRLLIFDATDPYTPVGDLPDYLQGSKAMLISADHGGLIQMPVTSPEFDTLERHIEVQLLDSGMIAGTIREKAYGQTSAYFRREHRSLSPAEYRKVIEGWLTRGATGAQLVKLDTRDRPSDWGFDIEVEFAAARYGQLMQNRLLVFKPIIVGRRNGIYLTEPQRSNPIELESNSMRETIAYSLPAGFVIDEIPEAVKIDSQFGSYSANFEVKDGKLLINRKITLRRSIIEPARYSEVRNFFTKIMDTEQSPVVLVKK